MSETLIIKRIHPDAILPVRASLKAAGLDLFSSENIEINVGDRKMVPTGITAAICEGHYGSRLWLSSLSVFKLFYDLVC